MGNKIDRFDQLEDDLKDVKKRTKEVDQSRPKIGKNRETVFD